MREETRLHPRSGLPGLQAQSAPRCGLPWATPQRSGHGRGALQGPPPGHSLLGATLSALGSTAVVPDEAAEAHSHSRVTVVHGHHGHLLSGWPVGQAQAADVGLGDEKAVSVTSRQRPPPVPQPQHPPPNQPGLKLVSKPAVMGERGAPKLMSLPEPQNVALFGNWHPADVIGWAEGTLQQDGPSPR